MCYVDKNLKIYWDLELNLSLRDSLNLIIKRIYNEKKLFIFHIFHFQIIVSCNLHMNLMFIN